MPAEHLKHGKMSSYTRGCRCGLCIAGAVEYRAQNRHKWKAQSPEYRREQYALKKTRVTK